MCADGASALFFVVYTGRVNYPFPTYERSCSPADVVTGPQDRGTPKGLTTARTSVGSLGVGMAVSRAFAAVVHAFLVRLR